MFRKTITIAGMCLSLLSCSPKQTTGTEKATTVSLDDEAKKVAAKISSLLYAKCDDGYYQGSDDRRVLGPYPAIEVHTFPQESISDLDRFFGYQWKGTVSFGLKGEILSLGLNLFKRGDKWFLRTEPGAGHDYVEVSNLKNIAPGCPTKQGI